jgi:hypothetical protein
MKKEDYELIVFGNRRLRRVPELPCEKPEECPGDPCCEMCIACPIGGEFDEQLCESHRSAIPNSCSLDSAGCIYLPEEDFQEYVVELVRRRVSS